MHNLLKKVGKFETHHRILAFSLIFVATILFLRLATKIYNPNPVFFNLELHHFDYGVILLLIVVKLLLFGNRRYDNLYLFLASVSSAFIVDGYLALRLAVVENHDLQMQVYTDTMIPVIITTIVSTLTILFINAIKKRK